MKILLVALTGFCILLSSFLFGQEETLQDGFHVFYHQNGKVSSEGDIFNGKPEGYWKTYNEEGILLSEGNRKNHLLDSTWKFYDDYGNLKMIIRYREGKKNGLRITYRDDGTVEEDFIDDLKQGFTYHYYPDGKIRRSIPFINGLEEGTAKEYAEDGRIIQLITYKKGFIVNRERINRYDSQGKEHGVWKYYHDNEKIRLECVYRHGIMNGYYKEYNQEGNLLQAYKYVNGEIAENVVEFARLDVKTQYYPSGNIKIKATYKDDRPEGVWREYSEEGKIEKTYVYKYGIIIGEGIITEQGNREGPWKEYYENGLLKGEGMYSNDVKKGLWTYYHMNGNIEQSGTYDSLGRPEGMWKWYYSSGVLKREENYREGLPDGPATEYSDLGKTIVKINFRKGLEDGDWYYAIGDYREEGGFIDGMRDGQWKSYYTDGTTSFQGRFIEDNPHGEHIWYWDNGKIREKGNFLMGRKHGDWIIYNYDGTPFLVITYENGIEKKYDGINIIPEFSMEEPE